MNTLQRIKERATKSRALEVARLQMATRNADYTDAAHTPPVSAATQLRYRGIAYTPVSDAQIATKGRDPLSGRGLRRVLIGLGHTTTDTAGAQGLPCCETERAAMATGALRAVVQTGPMPHWQSHVGSTMAEGKIENKRTTQIAQAIFQNFSH